MKKYISRPTYEKQIQSFLGKHYIKVLSGQRRTGKSMLLSYIGNVFKNHILYIDLEFKNFLDDIRKDGLYHYIKKNISDTIHALCIDEIQKIPQRELDLLSIYREYPDLEIRISGSNSDMLTNDLTTQLRGRYIEIQVYPFSYEEFCSYFDLTQGSESFMKYVEIGGFAGTYEFIENGDQKKQLKNIIDTIFIRDIVERYEISDIYLLDTLFLYLVNTVGGYFSSQGFLEYYTKLKKTTFVTLQQYLQFLSQAFMIYPIQVFDLQGKQIIQRQQKFYLSDHSRRKVMFSSFDPGQGKELENIIYIQARRMGRDVFVGKIKDKEIDFVIQKGKMRKYIQVCYLLSSEDVIQREFGSLEMVDDNFPKYVISLDPLIYDHPKGIKHLQFWNLDELFM